VRSLVVTHTFPWPARGGGAIRAAHTIDALAGLGPVDVACILRSEAVDGRPVPPDATVDRVLLLGRPPHGTSRWRRVPWLVGSRLPSIRSADYSTLRAQFAAWAGNYDLAWLGCGSEAFVALGPELRRGMPIVANLDDIEDHKIESRRAAGPLTCADGATRAPWHRDQADRIIARAEIRRWRRLHVQIAGSVARVVVCSELDRRALEALGITNAVVVPNVYSAPASPVGRASVREPPTLSMVGTLHYPPNADAARFMVACVLPEVHRKLPGVELRLVGDPGSSTSDLARRPGVIATGLVDDIESELARADVAVVPVRYGSGTRIKILEAFAHRIPVVSTTVGAEGLDVAHGRELLLADDPSQFAAACVDLLTDNDLRRRLVGNAHDRWRRHHHSDELRDRVVAIAGELVDPRL
jgi:glycosyltransferase involved in cell wall biosynthesis